MELARARLRYHARHRRHERGRWLIVARAAALIVRGRTLPGALEAYASRLDAAGVRIRLHGAAPAVGAQVAAQAYRLGADAMTSAVSHAHADPSMSRWTPTTSGCGCS